MPTTLTPPTGNAPRTDQAAPPPSHELMEPHRQLMRRFRRLAFEGRGALSAPVVTIADMVSTDWTPIAGTDCLAREIVLPDSATDQCTAIVCEWPATGRYGGVFPAHRHQQSQTFYVVQGRCVLTVEGERVELRAGEVFRVEAGVEHEGQAVEDVVLISLFEPPLPIYEC